MFQPVEPNNPIIFLDFDGVICTPNTYKSKHKTEDWWQIDIINADEGSLFCKTRIQRIEKVGRSTGAQIVLSTAWRNTYPLPSILGWLRAKTLTLPVVGKTDYLDDDHRGDEILLWLQTNNIQHTNWIAIDDTWDIMKPIPDEHLIKTYWKPPHGKPCGFGRVHIQESIDKLGGRNDEIYYSRQSKDGLLDQGHS